MVLRDRTILWTKRKWENGIFKFIEIFMNCNENKEIKKRERDFALAHTKEMSWEPTYPNSILIMQFKILGFQVVVLFSQYKSTLKWEVRQYSNGDWIFFEILKMYTYTVRPEKKRLHSNAVWSKRSKMLCTI